MTNGSTEAKWPRLLSLSVHEFRTPITVVAGSIRMLLKDRAGPLSVEQRRLLIEAEKSCARLSALISEMSDLANLEAGAAPFNKSAVDLREVLKDAVSSLPAAPERPVDVQLTTGGGPAPIQGDPVRLKVAFAALLTALRRELVTTTQLFVTEREADFRDRPASWITIGSAEDVAELDSASSESLTIFNEWRGGCGLSLAVARRIIEGHGGAMWSPVPETTPEGGSPLEQRKKSGAVIVLPH